MFFFQAEDGIRDLTVTGVQTCALPISVRREWIRPRSLTSRETASKGFCKRSNRRCGQARTGRSQSRSEERRVGKEFRARIVEAHDRNQREREMTEGSSGLCERLRIPTQ